MPWNRKDFYWIIYYAGTIMMARFKMPRTITLAVIGLRGKGVEILSEFYEIYDITVFRDPVIDTMVINTPNRLQVLKTVWAFKVRKHVYVWNSGPW